MACCLSLISPRPYKKFQSKFKMSEQSGWKQLMILVTSTPLLLGFRGGTIFLTYTRRLSVVGGCDVKDKRLLCVVFFFYSQGLAFLHATHREGTYLPQWLLAKEIKNDSNVQSQVNIQSNVFLLPVCFQKTYEKKKLLKSLLRIGQMALYLFAGTFTEVKWLVSRKSSRLIQLLRWFRNTTVEVRIFVYA